MKDLGCVNRDELEKKHAASWEEKSPLNLPPYNRLNSYWTENSSTELEDKKWDRYKQTFIDLGIGRHFFLSRRKREKDEFDYIKK